MEKNLYEKQNTKTKEQKQINWPPVSSQDGIIGTLFTLLPETTIKADKIYGTMCSDIEHRAA